MIHGYDVTDLIVDEMTYEVDKGWYVDEHCNGLLFTELTILPDDK